MRRAQSERRYLSPWQASCPAGPQHHTCPAGHPFPACPAGHTNLSFLHQGPRGPSGWSRVDLHHYAPRTAFIPPAHPRPYPPRMVGQSPILLGGALDLWGSMRYRPLPPISHAQLPPLALGSRPLAPPSPMVLPTVTLEERLAQDRLAAFLAGESSPHRPRSILSCPGKLPCFIPSVHLSYISHSVPLKLHLPF